MIKIGIIGQGFIGKMHLATLRQSKLATVTAVADREPSNLEGKVVAGNIDVSGDISLEGVARYEEGDALLRDPNVEAVLIALPTYMHKEYILKAAEKGKHILCEKPLTLTSAEGREVLEALNGYDRVFMSAQCIRFWPVYVEARNYIRSGVYGKLLSAQFTRQSCKPTWSWQNWLLDGAKSGGALLDLHIHDVDYVNYLFGMPDQVEAIGCIVPREDVSQVNAYYRYANGPVVAVDGGWMHPADFPFRMGFRMEFEQATLEFDSRIDANLHVYPAGGGHLTPDLLPGDGYSREHEYFLRSIMEGNKAEEASPESALASVALVERERAAIRTVATA
ncbi:MAG: 1,5-anhydro-D-fructose reductase [Candidatus Hydrogenedentes bacterium ADurb.Bin179]|nr:MAG: 1,5-anhydro-D-fructose reductase [Candidatus Hydrogenedentes bacterium ADurb.Bin179]